MIANHLSKIERTIDDKRELEIEDGFPDKQLFQVKI